MLQRIYRLFNSIYQLSIDYFYINSIKYLPLSIVETKYLLNKNISFIDEYLKKDGTYRKSLPLFSIINFIKPEAAKSNLKCNAYALKILAYGEVTDNKRLTNLILFLNKESCTVLDSKEITANEVFNVLQVISAFIEIKKIEPALCLYHKIQTLNVEWQTLPYFIRASYILVIEQLAALDKTLDISHVEIIANDLYANINLEKINLNNSFTGLQGFSSHELGYFLLFSVQLNYVKDHPAIYKTIMDIVEKFHLLFVREKIIFDDGSKRKKQMINNSGVALVASVFFQSSVLTGDCRYGNAALFLMDYLIANQNRYLGLLPNALPVWGRKSPFQFPLWTQYYLLLAERNKTNFLDSIK